MMSQMKKNRNSYSPYSSYNSNSHHGNSNMDKMKNDNQDYSSSSYSSDDAFDMFSEMFDGSDRTTRLLPTAQTMPLTCSARCSMALTGWTTTGAPTTTRTRWAACLTSRTCSTPCASRGPLETTSTLETGWLRSLPSRSTTWRPRSAT